MAREDRGAGGPQVIVRPDRVAVGAGSGHGEVVLVRYDPNIVQVAVQHGENGGRTLPHRNVVHEVVHLGEWNGAPRAFALPAPTRAGLKTAVLVQAGRGGAILAAGRG